MEHPVSDHENVPSFFSRYWFLFLVSLVYLIASWGKPFASRGEAREAFVALQMKLTGNYILPLSYNDVIPSKPPILHWFINLFSIGSEGISEFATRLPSALAAVGFLVFFNAALRRYKNDSFATLATILLATSFEWVRAATTARVDMLLAAFLASSLCIRFFYRKNFYYRLLSVVLLLGAFLTKGPIALVLWGTIVGAFMLTERSSIFSIIKELFLYLAPVFCLGLLWYAAASIQEPERFFAKFYYENVSRFAGTMEDEPHKHSPFYLYGMLLLGSAPWSILGLGISIQLLRSKESFLSQWWNDKLYRFALLACFLIIVFFSIPSSKRGVYLLPCYPFLSILIADLLIRAQNFIQQYVRILSGGLIALSALGVIVFCGAFLIAGLGISLGTYLSATFLNLNWFVVSPVLLIFIAAACILSLLREKHEGMTPIGVGLIALLSVGSSFDGVGARALSYDTITNEVMPLVKESPTLYSYGDEFYGFAFYMQKHFKSVAHEINSGDIIFLYAENLNELRSHHPEKLFQEIYQSKSGVVKFNKRVILVKVL